MLVGKREKYLGEELIRGWEIGDGSRRRNGEENESSNEEIGKI